MYFSEPVTKLYLSLPRLEKPQQFSLHKSTTEFLFFFVIHNVRINLLFQPRRDSTGAPCLAFPTRLFRVFYLPYDIMRNVNIQTILIPVFSEKHQSLYPFFVGCLF